MNYCHCFAAYTLPNLHASILNVFKMQNIQNYMEYIADSICILGIFVDIYIFAYYYFQCAKHKPKKMKRKCTEEK